MIVPKTQIKQLEDGVDADDVEDFEAPDEYYFWGLVQGPGEVCPVNIDYCVYYTSDSVQESPDLTDTPIRIDHMVLPENREASNIGVVEGEAVLQDLKFSLNKITRGGWDEFVQAVEDENGNISLTYNQLVREIHAGNLALSAGLGVRQASTPVSEHTIVGITQWDEVSIVGKPANPGSWAWGCEGTCDLVFGEQSMSGTQTLNIDLEKLQQEAEEGSTTSQLVEVLQSDEWGDDVKGEQVTPDGFTTIESDEDLTQSGCTCDEQDGEAEELRQELKEVKQERDRYKDVLDNVRSKQLDQAMERLQKVNDALPEDEQYSDEELEQMKEDSTPKSLNQTADMLERVLDNVSGSKDKDLEQGKEDLSGSSGSGSNQEENDELEQKVNEVSQGLFDRPIDEVFDEIESGTWGN